jgi:S1-C subfamily serine protease
MPIKALSAFAASLLLTFLAILPAALRPEPASAQQRSTEEILKAVVKIQALIPADARSAASLGTTREGHGAVIGDDGLILTIGYLVLEADQVTVVQHDGKELPATVVAYDHDSGFGLVRAARPVSATPLVLGDSSALTAEMPAVAASFGGADTAMPVRVTARREFAGFWEYLLEDAVFTMPPYPNFGGAALLNQNGELVGIGSLLVADAKEEGAFGPGNMFVPINRFKPIRQDLVTTGRAKEPRHPWLGLHTEEIHGRLFVQRVAEGGPSAAAGIAGGDIIVSVGDVPVQSQKEFYRKVWSYGAPGVRVPITVLTSKSGLRTVDVASTDRHDYLRRPRGN